MTLTDDERRQLGQRLAKGKAAARTRRHAHLLLQADPTGGGTDAQVAEAFDVSVRAVERRRPRFVAEGFEAALQPKPVPRLPRKGDGAVEAHLVARAGSDPPEGRQRWTLRLLAGRLVELGHGASLAHEGVRPALKETS